MSASRRVLLFTGDGKGKTTAALGMLLRASGHGMRSLVIQFIKADASTGEIAAVKHLPGAAVVQTGRGFVPSRDKPGYAEHQKAAADGLRMAAEALAQNKYDLLILDEICTAVAKGLLEETQVTEMLANAPGKTCVVLTGRSATPALLASADTATEMRCLKHGLQAGWTKQAGVEY